MAKSKAAPITYPTEDVFAAACAADRINSGEYVSTSDYPNENSKPANKSLMLLLLTNSLEITEDDRAKSDLVLTNYQALTFKILSGKTLSEFESKAMELASAEVISERDIGIIAYLPVGYRISMVARSVDQRLRDCESEFCGAINSKVSLSIEVVRKVYSNNYNCHFVTGITKDNLAVSFATSNGLHFELNKTYDITAKVKAHNEGPVTKLNNVKLSKTLDNKSKPCYNII
jgi:hypothetical protein